jgi:tetratricopeptide (TPR) repeat protein
MVDVHWARPIQQEISMPRFALSRLSTNRRNIVFLGSLLSFSVVCLMDYQARTERQALRDGAASCADVTIPAATAVAACSAVIGSNPKASWAYANRGLAYSSSMQQDRAIADLDMAISIDLEYARAYAIRAVAYGLKGDRARAIADYTKAIALNPADALTYSNRASAHLQNGESKLAIADASRAIEINPKLAAAYFNRAAAYKKTGDTARAIEDYRSALALNPGDPRSTDGLKRLGVGG